MQMTKERAIRLIYGYTAATKKDHAIVDRIADRMVEKGEGVYHATAQVIGKPESCWCCKCRPDIKRIPHS